jgi:antirestriction protein ArdC
MFGIANEPRSDHAAYVGSWLKVLDHDRRAIFTAASKAQEAINYLSALAFENGFKS